MYCSEEADKRQKYLPHRVVRQDSKAVEAVCTVVRRQTKDKSTYPTGLSGKTAKQWRQCVL